MTRRWRLIAGIGSIAVAGVAVASLDRVREALDGSRSETDPAPPHARWLERGGAALHAAVERVEPGPGMAARLAGALDRLTDPGVAPSRAGALALSAAGSRPVAWAVRELADEAGAGDEGRRALARYLTRAAAAPERLGPLLPLPGVLPALLRLAAADAGLAASLGAALSPGRLAEAAPPADVRAVLAWLEEDPGTGVESHGLGVAGAPLLAARSRAGSSLQHDPAASSASTLLALRCLRGWAQASVVNCATLARAGAGPVLPRFLALAAGQPERQELCGLMKDLARGCPPSVPLEAAGWLHPQLCTAADAAAAGEGALLHASLTAFAACVRRRGPGDGVPPALLKGTVLPLLHRISAGGNESPRRPVATVVRALAMTGALDPAARDAWAETVLGWARHAAGEPSGEADAATLRRSARACQPFTLALESLVEAGCRAGLYAWLAEMVVALSFVVQPYGEEALAAVKGDQAALQAGSRTAAWLGGWLPAWAGGQALAVEAGAPGAGLAPGSTRGPPHDAEGPASSWWAWRPWGGGESPPAEGTLDAAPGALDPAADRPAPALGTDAGPPSGPAPAAPPGGPNDSDLALYIHAAPVGPAFVRAVAGELLPGSTWDLPLDASEDALSSLAVARAGAPGGEGADAGPSAAAVAQTIAVMTALASDEARRAWLLRMGVLRALRLVLAAQEGPPADDAEAGWAAPGLAGGGTLTLALAQQAARLLSLLGTDAPGARALASGPGARDPGGWVAWLQSCAGAADCSLSSAATKALLHAESVRGEGRAARSLLPGPAATAAARRAAATDGGEAPWAAPALAVEVLEAVRAALDGEGAAGGAGARGERRLVLRDGMHLFVPGAEHHAVLARCGRDATGPGTPLMDVVFVHGIRGGAFATWRQEGSPRPGKGAAFEHHACWPAAWLSEELPEARLLTVEYAAPASGWEGESLPFEHTVAQLAGMLLDAGVGARPTVFVCHSMGGVLVKELLAQAQAKEQGHAWHKLACNTLGLVSYAVPHSGSRLADLGWQLRYVGGFPAGAVAHLKTSELHLEDVNAAVRGMHRRGGLAVLSFGEGKPTRVAYIKTLVVPLESAYPGYGEFFVLPSHDHVSACKPTDRSDAAYAKALDFLGRCARSAARRRAEAHTADDVEAAAL
ncbi:hypothetical protein ACKKBF_B33870 [Auxenochlorella protothecoides x Auxenochlorella symbiontica]